MRKFLDISGRFDSSNTRRTLSTSNFSSFTSSLTSFSFRFTDASHTTNMATLNTSHHSDGGVLLYAGELILLFCDQVQCEVVNKGSVKGRIFLTTHRILFVSEPLSQNASLQSLAAPFSALFDMSLEQPVFGANYIKGRLRTDSSTNQQATTQNEYQFKLKFSRGGAIEFGQALREASRRVPAYTPAPMATGFMPPFAPNQYYQAPDTVYQPNYSVGFALPTHIFSQAPPPGFVYTSQAPPPYPGLNGQPQQVQQPQNFAPAYTPSNPIGLGTSVQVPVQFQAYPSQPYYQPQYPQYPPQYPQYPPQYPPSTQQQQQQPPPSYGSQNGGPPGYVPDSQPNYPTKQ